jgi:hypothetical protein
MHVKAAYPNYNLCKKLFFEDFRKFVTPGSDTNKKDHNCD